jgi:PAS domain S-box-containing protein
VINWAELEIQPIRNYKEKIEKFIIVIKNISNEKRYKLQLKKSEEEYKYIIDNISEVIFQTDTKGNWTFLNNAWVEIMGYSFEESLNTLFFNYLYPEDVERNALLFGPLIRKEKENYRHAIRYVAKNGAIKWMQVFAKLLFNDSGELTGTTGTLKDITNDMQNQHFSNVLLNNINDIICIFNKEGVIKYISPSFFEITGYLSQDITNKNIFEFIHPKDAEQISNSITELQKKKTKEGFYNNFRIRYANGAYKWIELNSNVFKDEFYAEELIVASAREINQRKKTELEMIGTLKKQKELNELKSQFVQMTSHEFRNPLAIIKSSVELMEYYLQPNKEVDKSVFEKHTGNIKKEVDRLAYLMNEILTYGKIENDAIKLKPMPVQLSTFIQGIITRNLDKIFLGREILLELSENERIVNIDPILMEHIIDNLITNALKYSEGKKDPIITINYHKTYFELIVKDFGIGISPKDMIKLFTPFHRGSNVNLIKGTGMGLAIARKFIELHKGSIKCESTIGSGTRFIVKMEYL